MQVRAWMLAHLMQPYSKRRLKPADFWQSEHPEAVKMRRGRPLLKNLYDYDGARMRYLERQEGAKPR